VKTSKWLTAFWVLILALPFIVLGIERIERISQERISARHAAREQARNLLLEAQALAIPKDSIGWLLRLYQQKAEAVVIEGAGNAASKRRRLIRLYQEMVKPWLPAHALRWRLKPTIGNGPETRIEVAAGKRFPAKFGDRFFGYRWLTLPRSLYSMLEAELARMMACPIVLEFQDRTKNGKIQSFVGLEKTTGLYWRVLHKSGIIAWLDLTGIDPALGMKIAAARQFEAGCGLLFIDEHGAPVVGGGEWRSEAGPLLKKLSRLSSKGNMPSVAVVGRRLVMTGLLPAGMQGRIIVTVPWPSNGDIGLNIDTVPLAVTASVAFFASLVLLAAASFVARRASVGWMLLGACLGLAIVPAGAGWGLVRRAVTEYGRIELKQTADTLHNDLINLDKGGMALHATLVGRLLRAARNPSTFEELNAHPTTQMRPTLFNVMNECRLPDTYQKMQKSPELILGVAPDDKFGILCNRRMNEPDSPEADRPILEVFGPFARKIRDSITRRDRKNPDGERTGAEQIRESMKSDILYDLYMSVIGIDAMIAQITFPQELVEVKTSFLRIFLLGLQVFRDKRIPTEWFLFWIWEDSIEECHINRIFIERFGESTSFGRIEAPATIDSPDAEPQAPEIWMVGGMAELMSNEWIAPPVAAPLALQRALERARQSGTLQIGRDMSAPGRPVFEAFPGINLPRFVLAGQVTTHPIEKSMYWMQLAGNALAIGLVVSALMLAWYGRGRLLKPLERLRLAMLEVASGHFETRMPTDRSDEFGTLAVAFNSMTKALQEAAILGRFVSGSVRRAVRDRRADESGRGEHREVTILFSCLFHFEQICHDRDVAFVFEALGEHLGAFNAELKRFAGAAEIDKVIGDKILVVFDHERFGGREAAAGAVLAVVRGVRRRISELHLETAMGINTGMVISGILGAKSVRLDHTVIGDPVNLASRLSLLAHMTDGTRTVLSGAFLEACNGAIRTEKLPFRKVKGKTQEVEAYLLIDPGVCAKNTRE